MNGDICPQLHEKLVLHLIDAVLRVENQGFVFLEIGCDVAFAVCERLAAHVIFRDAVQLGVRDFDIIAGGFVIADLERIDAAASAFALFHLGNPPSPVVGSLLNLVQFGAKALLDDAAFGDTDGRLLDDSAFDQGDDIAIVGEAFHQAGERGHLCFGVGWGAGAYLYGCS